jgi:DNA-binding NarL/FixJ family response regulator
VLVVDDHAVVRRGLASMLSTAADIQCVGTAADGAAALELILRLRPDVVLLDLSRPGGGGLDLMRDLQTRDLDVRVLVLTSYNDPELVLDAVRAGADGYLLKQSEAEQIIDAVRAIAAGAAPFDSDGAGRRDHGHRRRRTRLRRGPLEEARSGRTPRAARPR